MGDWINLRDFDDGINEEVLWEKTMIRYFNRLFLFLWLLLFFPLSQVQQYSSLSILHQTYLVSGHSQVLRQSSWVHWETLPSVIYIIDGASSNLLFNKRSNIAQPQPSTSQHFTKIGGQSYYCMDLCTGLDSGYCIGLI